MLGPKRPSFYSALKTLAPELSNKPVAEHQVTSSGGLRDLSVLSASEAMWLAKLQVLRDEVLHHFQGEVGGLPSMPLEEPSTLIRSMPWARDFLRKMRL
jgi:hypothetical protein